MFQDRYCVGRFQFLDSTHAALSRPARKWIEPIVQDPLECAITMELLGLWFDTDGYYVFNLNEIDASARLFVKRLCVESGCTIIDCLGRVVGQSVID